jgi:DNA segregation ATPase FtsK/SpoIIIE-like protein
MKRWLRRNRVELILGIGLSLFLINFFTEQDDGLYIFSIPLIVLGALMMYKRHFRSHLFNTSDSFLSSLSIDDDDELYDDAKEAVIEAGKASTSYIQRKLRIGYSRAARLIDMLEANGVIGPQIGAGPREVNSQIHGKKTE